MLVTKMVLHSAIDGYQTVLLTIQIVNDATGDNLVGNYNWTVESKELEGTYWKKGRIENWPRLERTAMQLLAEVVKRYLEEK